MYSHEEDIDSAIDIFKQAIGHYQSEQVGVVEVDKTAWSLCLHGLESPGCDRRCLSILFLGFFVFLICGCKHHIPVLRNLIFVTWRSK